MLSPWFVALALLGQDVAEPDRNCLDDNHTNRCAEEVQAATRAKLGVAAIASEAETGAEIYRAFFVDGYGNDMPVVAFERRPGHGPVAVVYGTEGRTMSAPVSAEVWNRVRSESVMADRSLADRNASPQADGRGPPPPPMCLHSWVQTVEMANSRPERWTVVPVRSRTEDSCGGALTSRFAHLLAELAVEAIAPCDVLDEKHQRNRVTQLGTCLSLKGDRLAAAELRNERVDFGLRPGADATNVYAWQAAMGTNGSPRLVWGGQEIRTERGRDKNVAQFLMARHAEFENLRFHQRTFEGIDAQTAVAEGVANYVLEGTTWQAPYRQTWVWDTSMMQWMVSDWVVEPFAAVPAAR